MFSSVNAVISTCMSPVCLLFHWMTTSHEPQQPIIMKDLFITENKVFCDEKRGNPLNTPIFYLSEPYLTHFISKYFAKSRGNQLIIYVYMYIRQQQWENSHIITYFYILCQTWKIVTWLPYIPDIKNGHITTSYWYARLSNISHCWCC